jgi:hypothetical protein
MWNWKENRTFLKFTVLLSYILQQKVFQQVLIFIKLLPSLHFKSLYGRHIGIFGGMEFWNELQCHGFRTEFYKG